MMRESIRELSKREVVFILVIVLLLVSVGLLAWKIGKDKNGSINSFAECVDAGNEVMDSFPEQCRAGDKTFANITNFEQCKTAGYPIQETFPERCSANGQSFTRDVGKIEPYFPGEGEVAFTEFPVSLQDAIKTKLQEMCTGEQLFSGDALFSYAVASKESYVENKYVSVTLTCGEGAAAGLFALKDDKWEFVALTQDQYPCDPLVEFKIPRSFVAECYEEVGRPPVVNPVNS